MERVVCWDSDYLSMNIVKDFSEFKKIFKHAGVRSKFNITSYNTLQVDIKCTSENAKDYIYGIWNLPDCPLVDSSIGTGELYGEGIAGLEIDLGVLLDRDKPVVFQTTVNFNTKEDAKKLIGGTIVNILKGYGITPDKDSVQFKFWKDFGGRVRVYFGSEESAKQFFFDNWDEASPDENVYRVFGGWCVVDDSGAYLEGYFNILQWD